MPYPSSHVFHEDDRYLIRPAKNTDEFRDMWWSFMQQLGWNRGYYDLDSYMNPSTASGMILLVQKADARPVGHVAAVMDRNHTAWISMFIIDENHRGSGLGRELFKAGMKDAHDHGATIIGLDGVKEQKPTYERRRFVESPLGLIKIMMRPLLAAKPITSLSQPHVHDQVSIINVKEVPPRLLAQYDFKYSGFERPGLWSNEHLLNRPDLSGIALVSKTPPETIDDLKAWCMIRRCSGGLRLAPLYADDTSCAEKILTAAMKTATPKLVQAVPLPKEPISDLPEDKIANQATLVAEVWCGNPNAEKVFEGLGWEFAGVAYHRMWVDGKCPPQWEGDGLAQKGCFATFDAATG